MSERTRYEAAMTTSFDIIVIGSGIAGASVAAHLAETSKVLVLEMEERPGYHSTGRSAAHYEPNYGPAAIRALTRAARGHFDALGALTTRHSLFLMPAGQEREFATLMASQQGMHEIAIAEAHRLFPILRQGYASRASLDPGTADIDVDMLHQSYLKQFKSRGGTLLCSQPAEAIDRSNGQWRVRTPDHLLEAPIIVDSAGAWGARVGALAWARPIGLQPKRRSVAVVPLPQGVDASAWPLTTDVGETWYCKPQSGKLLVSPADATPVDPHDAYADDMTLAEGIDRFQQAVTLEVTRVERSWGGLRSFSPDGNPVVGYDNLTEGFFWLIGQGGYGIQTSPALSRLAAALINGREPPSDIVAEGLSVSDLAPARFAGQAIV
jgi:D-arginine dehydrogenase